MRINKRYSCFHFHANFYFFSLLPLFPETFMSRFFIVSFLFLLNFITFYHVSANFTYLVYYCIVCLWIEDGAVLGKKTGQTFLEFND